MNVMPNVTSQKDVTTGGISGASSADPLWYKDAIIYQLHVKAYADSNNDGIGDFAGLTGKLDYLQELGVTTLWLLPFYPSPGRDDGYDIGDYGSVNPDFGTMRDFRRFMVEAKRRGLRVITELVINHTSDQHTWFKRARRSPKGSSARNWYVWSDTDQKYRGTRIIFTDTEKSNWAWDAEANAYYWHRFFSHQPDLNFDNPRVVRAVMQVMKRWLDTGVDGFRLDAIPYLCEREGTNNENLPETHRIIKQLRSELDAYAKDKIFLAEANQWPEDVQQYLGDGDECHMAYHFPLMPRIYMAIAQEDRFPITDILRQTPDIPDNCQWALFLRNHDELTLEMVTDVERDYLWSTYANDPRARINLGIRRRLAPLMENDRRKIELMNSLLLSFPGTPIIYYGDEIGMGDNIYLGDRNGVRTPMQWSPDRNGGFSRADPARLYAPTIMDPVYGYEVVNVEAQSQSLSSLLSWTKRLISVRKSSLAFGRGSITFIRPVNRSILAYVRRYNDEVILCVANLSRAAQATELDLSAWKDRIPLEMLGRTTFPRIGELPYMITLAPYGFYWFKLNEQPVATRPPEIVPEFETLVVPAGSVWESLGRTRGVFERDVLPQHLALAHWFPEQSQFAIKANLLAAVPCAPDDVAQRPWFAFCEASYRGQTHRYVLPLRIDWSRIDRSRYNPSALAAVRQGAREGTLFDVVADKDFIALLLNNIHAGFSIESHGIRLEFLGTDQFLSTPLKPVESVRRIHNKLAGSLAMADAHYVVKIYRELESGVNPEIEVGRFLTEIVGFSRTPALLGSIEAIQTEGRCAIGIVHECVENRGDVWTIIANLLDRFIEEQRLLRVTDKPASPEDTTQSLFEQIGKSVAGMHVALASRDDLRDFSPQEVTQADIQGWRDGVMERGGRIFEMLHQQRDATNETNRTAIDQLLAFASRFNDDIPGLLFGEESFHNIRLHGDLGLDQLLIVKDDVFVIGFAGDPHQPFAERRRKAPAARDVAALIRSIDLAASAALERAHRAENDDGLAAAALAQWRDRSTATLLAAYRAHMSDGRLWPTDSNVGAHMLNFFQLEKAFDEIDNDLAHHHDRLAASLAATVRLLSRLRGGIA